MDLREEKKKVRRSGMYLKWLLICMSVFMISIFAHECGHGFANALAGIPCSTGFNRVGDIYKNPKDADFRESYSNADPVLLDFGVPCTLILSVVGTMLYLKSGKTKLRHFGVALAIDNCLLRFIPCSMVLFTPLLTGRVHVEDEYETGQLLVGMTGNGLLLYMPAFVSWIITAACIAVIIRTARKRKTEHAAIYFTVSVLAMCIGFAAAMVLDNYVRINWQPF
jgi:hypothetical protein